WIVHQTNVRFYCIEEIKLKYIYLTDLHNKTLFWRERFFDQARRLVYNVTRIEAADIVLKCVNCHSKRHMATKGPIKPIIEKHPRDRYIADLIDLSAFNDKNCGFLLILVYMNNSFTKFRIAKPLKSRSANDVAGTYSEIFTTFAINLTLHRHWSRIQKWYIGINIKKV
ncbi:hypothetical protein M153_71300001146, partial [Pseudoloma neurophilia]